MEKADLRTHVQKGIYRVINPFVKLLIKLGLTPNAITTIGLLLNIGVAVIFIAGAEEGNRGDFRYVGWAGALILFAGLFDMLDGQVARLGNMSSRFGAMYDSVLDRYSEMIMFLGICYYLVGHHYFIGSLIGFIGLIGSVMVSYTRARAEGLGIESKGGLMQRPERVILIGVAALGSGITSYYIGGDYKLFIKGIPFHVFETMSVFIFPLTILAVLSNITAIRRLVDAKKALDKKERSEKLSVVSRHESKVKALSLLIIVVTALSAFTFPVNTSVKKIINNAIDPQDTFPVPKGNKNQLFYLQRTPNENTIVCELNYLKSGQLDAENPVHVFWIRYQDAGKKVELSFLQRTFAYGIKSKPIGDGKYELRFVSYKKTPLYLIKSQADNKYHVYTNVGQKEIVLNRIFIKINPGGSFWSPNVEYIEYKGTDPASGKEILERRKV
jgi:phosphatidylglycerophosphate synthase